MNICLVSDFFHPKLGGVEIHIFALAISNLLPHTLSLGLLKRGHKVIVLTHAYADRQGVRYLTNALKVFYLPVQPVIDQVALFTMFTTLPLLRHILLSEQIHIVHSHSSTSYLGNEVLLHAQVMGFKTLYTDHSLFALNDAASFHVNKILKFILADIDHAISVSHISKENLCLRASLDPTLVSVIPNAIDCHKFTPDPTKRYPTDMINIVVVSRLAFRKGVDLLIEIIPQICHENLRVHFIIGGDGPKRKPLENMIEKCNLQTRVELLGGVPSHEVRNVLVRGHIFLNTSLTEAFCIAIVEAASCGLIVVSTDVGGVKEVLPESLVKYAKPNSADLLFKLRVAIEESRHIRSFENHQLVKQMYNWDQVATRTERIYQDLVRRENRTIFEKFRRAWSCGPYYSVYICILILVDLLLLGGRLLDRFVKVKRLKP